MAEGCVCSRTITIAAHKLRVKEVLDDIDVRNPSLKINRRKENKNVTELNSYNIHNVIFANYMAPHSVGAINKRLPDWVWSLNRRYANILLDGMMLGDGHIMANGTRRYDTSSKQLADDLQRLALHAAIRFSQFV